MVKVKRIIILVILLILLSLVILLFKVHNTGNIKKINNLNNINVYNMCQDEINSLPTTKVDKQTLSDEKSVEKQEVENEAFKEQGDIVYEGSSELPNVALGNYVGLTYYSQLDSRWKNHSYTAINNSNQTIGNSGCGPTCAAMIVTSIKGAITPNKMGDLFVKYGYRSANDGTYLSAFRWIADVFNIRYQEESNLNTVVNLLRNNYYVVVSCGTGLFTYDGHYIILTGVSGNTLSIYDPYLYSGKFDTSSRSGKATVSRKHCLL